MSSNIKQVKQKLRILSVERKETALQDIKRLKNLGFIREIFYLRWSRKYSNVKKIDRRWRMCLDFTHLIATYLKDNYPLPNINKLMDNNSRHELLSFMEVIIKFLSGKIMKRKQHSF